MNVRLVEVDLGELNAQVGTLNADYSRMKSEVADILADPEQAKLLGEHNSGALTVLLAKTDALVATFNRVLPVVNALRSEGLRRRRWKDLLSGVDAQTTEEELREKLLLRDLAHINMVEQGGADRWEEVSAAASKEALLEDSLEAMRLLWEAHMPMQVVEATAHSPRAMLIPAELQLTLEEHVIKTQMSASSPYATASLQPALKDWLRRLTAVQTTLTEYQKAETKWLYMEPLFGAEDIAYQMPEEWRAFQVGGGWG